MRWKTDGSLSCSPGCPETLCIDVDDLELLLLLPLPQSAGIIDLGHHTLPGNYNFTKQNNIYVYTHIYFSAVYVKCFTDQSWYHITLATGLEAEAEKSGQDYINSALNKTVLVKKILLLLTGMGTDGISLPVVSIETAPHLK